MIAGQLRITPHVSDSHLFCYFVSAILFFITRLTALANTFVKMLITLVGGIALFRYCFPIFAVMIATGLVVSFVIM